ncbi:NapC/NirT family cytochrome c [Vibrio parahaemolyticus]|uniref:NapC/NirT family cytochrome c n=1 Tax=Vibrio parahaemolyticus TaxID=670 RepID=UPI0010D787FF|nr:NapC/NirT family cytochrome c [Vibrio parahaemolyticus]EIV8654570.1 NapC/NirT family cytochrome c [Vibrio parahaemolyticus]EIV8656474.1 NapC/NirT family cytochrome c [Vibrio parahaemolyticus]MBE3810683.1 cytochrome C [Vibrio parahaemolyticus]MBE4243474.1 cytochrome C [Vibrio parahaemolyticus]MBE4457347.1 cytochrome C [Vibrio parahaemolyticus]
MSIKKRYIALLVAAGVGVGWLTLGGSAAVMHYTSDTEFCVSCHSMEIPYKEYQGSVHFSNAKGIRAECSDCHIPQEPMDYLITKIRASKDIYHEFVTGKIDTPEKYEAHRKDMAETVWAQFRENDSATCRSCHDFDAMEEFEQSRDAAKMHEYAQANDQTCIDCHKGVAHFAPEAELDSKAFETLMSFTMKTAANAKVVYPVTTINMGEMGTINPTTKLEVMSAEGDNRTVKLNAFQMKGAEQVLYMGEGQRAIVATLTEQGQQALEAGEFEADVYGNEWRSVSLTGAIDSPVVDTLDPVWSYAEELDNVYCATCHAKIPSNHFTVNAWGPVAKSMGDRTDISAENLEILTKFFQHHAKDVVGH